MRTVSRALVTGGAGFIGSHLVDALIARGIETVVIDNLSTGTMENLRQHEGNRMLRVVHADIREAGVLKTEVLDVDVVFHEAAIANILRSINEPMAVHDVNVNATLQLLSACLDGGVKRVIFASSAAVYGKLRDPPAREDYVCIPASPYGASKLAMENYLNAYYSTYGLEVVSLRYFNVYGPRQKQSDYSGVITIFVGRLLQASRPTIFGDGEQIRDFVNVRDIVNANLLAMESKVAVGEAFNVATGKSVSVLKMFEMLREATGAQGIEPEFAPPRPGDTKLATASIAKIQAALGYKPEVGINEGLSELVNSIRGSVVDGPMNPPRLLR